MLKSKLSFKKILTLFFICSLVTPLQAQQIKLEYSGSTSLEDSSIGLTEPSGLSYATKTDSLWLISDDTSAVFQINPGKKIEKHPIKDSEMEAIALVEEEGVYYTVNEKKGQITRFNLKTHKKLKRNKLKKMTGYESIQSIVKQAGKKSGLEGLAWHPKRKSLFALLEGPPGLLIEITPDLKTILSSTKLNKKRGFDLPNQSNKKIDYSGLTYDKKRDKLWILSDETSSLFIYDLASKKVIQTLTLKWQNKKAKNKKIDQPEGITLNTDSSTLYVVCDKKSKLYQWQIQDYALINSFFHHDSRGAE